MDNESKISPGDYNDIIGYVYKKFEMELADLNARHDRLEANMKKISEHLHPDA